MRISDHPLMNICRRLSYHWLALANSVDHSAYSRRVPRLEGFVPYNFTQPTVVITARRSGGSGGAVHGDASDRAVSQVGYSDHGGC